MAGEVGPALPYQNPVLTASGEERIIAWHNPFLRDEVGRVIGTLSSGEDITEQLRTDQELQRMRSYLKNIIDSMLSVLVGLDPDGRVTEWNMSAERATGVNADPAKGRPFTELFPHLESQMERIREALQRRTAVRSERVVVKHDGETRFADVMVYPLVANGVTGAVLRVDNVTNRVRIEQMMVQTKKMMSVGGLAAGMAHEINNPLSAVLQVGQNILRRVSPELPANQQVAEELDVDLAKVHRYLEQRGIVGFVEGIHEAGTRAARIVGDMLSFSRRSVAWLMPTPVDIMLETAVRLAASDYDLKKRYDFRQIEIVRNYDPDLGVLDCDRTEIEQVLLNLVRSGAQAMANGHLGGAPRIILRTRRAGDVARIEVEDNGPGMDENTRRRVFEPFFTTKPVGVGTGLGLSASYFIITEQRHGSIYVRSSPGRGSCFVIELPIQRRTAP
jgi:PAS domain S-box-containing protein